MSLSAAERNRRKRERKKAEKQDRKLKEKQPEDDDDSNLAKSTVEKEEQSDEKPVPSNEEEIQVEIEYVAEPLAEFTGFFLDTKPQLNDNEEDTTNTAQPESDSSTTNKDTKKIVPEDENDIEAVLRRFASRASVTVVSEDEQEKQQSTPDQGDSDRSDNEVEQKHRTSTTKLSRRKLRELLRPTIAELKQRVARPDLVEAHDVTAADPDFLLYLKSVPNTVPVPRHWGRRRKYLQGKRGIEKAPWKLPPFLQQTGIAELRSAQTAEEEKMSLKQKQRQRVQVRGGVDVDYKTLHDAFFKYQTKPPLTGWGDLYYEGKEFELRSNTTKFVPGKLSERLRGALGMTSDKAPPPWLIAMQRYGPPPAYPNLVISGLNAPLPEGCSYGYHVNGWGKPPVDAFGRGLYGDVFGPPTDASGLADDGWKTSGPDVITSDGKRLSRSFWGALPTAKLEEEEASSEEEEEMEESSEEEEGEE